MCPITKDLTFMASECQKKRKRVEMKKVQQIYPKGMTDKVLQIGGNDKRRNPEHDKNKLWTNTIHFPSPEFPNFGLTFEEKL